MGQGLGGVPRSVATTDQTRHDDGDESLLTVVVAGTVNLIIAAAKLVVGGISGSAAMLAEGAHSVGDTLNQVFLLTAVRRSRKGPDARHPFGYGLERYFWSLLAAVGIFVLGAGFAAYQGISVLVSGREAGPQGWSYVVLGLAFLFEGASLVRAVWQVRGVMRAEGIGWRAAVRGADPALRAVLMEDSAAVLGIVLAAGGLLLEQLTGDSWYDGLASLAIALLLVVVAVDLGRQNRDHLIGLGLETGMRREVAHEIESTEGVDGVVELLSLRLGPDEVLVAARVDVGHDPTGDEIEVIADTVETHIRERFPEIKHVFLDPTPPPGPSSG